MKRYEFKKQLNNRGYYAAICYDVTFTEERYCKLIVDYDGDTIWENACLAGISCFFNYFKRDNTGILEIKIHHIKWMQVDTSDSVVLFTTLMALSESLAFVLPDLRLDDNGVFHFPHLKENI